MTEEDLHKGFEANYGPRVRCLAIVLDNERRAQQVFEMARRDNTAKNFGDLAAQYSDRAGQPGAAGRSAADQEVRRPADPGGGGVQAEARRAFRRHPGGRQVRHPALRRLYRSRSTSTSPRSATRSTRTCSKRSPGWRWPSASRSCRNRPRSTTSWPAPANLRRKAGRRVGPEGPHAAAGAGRVKVK